MLGWDIIFLNSAEAADELLERRGAIYSDRPILQMSGELYVISDIPFDWATLRPLLCILGVESRD